VSAPRILILVVAFTLALFGYRYWTTGNQAEPVTAEIASVANSAPGGVLEEQERSNDEKEIPAPADKPACLTRKQFEELPEVIQDAMRMESVAVGGTAMSAYESLNEETLRGFADQGDSAAMAVIGAINVMRAYGLDESLAIKWLNQEQGISDLDQGNSQLSSAASLALNEAGYWFYEAAIHGRLLALQNYGRSRGRLFGGPVGLGWIGREEYDTLSASEKRSLVPADLYAQVAYDIAPALREGVLGDLSRMLPQSTLQETIRAELVSEFEQSLSDRGLPAISLPATASVEIVDLLDSACDFEIEEDARRRSLE
jgi:hypothetical protein